MAATAIADALARSALFSGLDRPALEAVAAEASLRRFRRGDRIFDQGDEGDALYVIARGLVKISLVSEDGHEVVLATLAPGETFGELAVIDGGPRSAGARAIEETELVVFRRQVFVRLLHEHTVMIDALHRCLGALLRRTLEQASDLVFLDLPGRVAKLLLKLAEEGGRPGEGGVLLDLQVTQGTLAAMVGGSRPTVNQILRSFEARGYIELSGRSILLREPARLLKRSGS